MRWLLVLIIVVPFAELYLLILIGRSIGFWPTIGMILVSGVLGATLAKYEGLRVWRSYSDAVAQGRLPDEGILGGLLVLVGGLLLIIPGVLTDAMGIALLVPFTRRWVAGVIRTRIEARMSQGLFKVVTMGSPFVGPVGQEYPGGGVDEPGTVERPFGWPEEERWEQREVLDTEGVEVQSTNLLAAPDSTRDGTEPPEQGGERP